MPTTTVYRVGHLSRRNEFGLPAGPYTDGPRCVSSGAPSHRPSPFDDGLADVLYDTDGVDMRDWLYGFQSREAAIAWFGDAIRTLDAAGYGVWMIEVDECHVFHGRRQTVYRADTARAVVAYDVHRFLRPDLTPIEVDEARIRAAALDLAWDEALEEDGYRTRLV